MRHPLPVAAAALALTLALAACGGDDGSSAGTSAATTSAVTTSAPTTAKATTTVAPTTAKATTSTAAPTSAAPTTAATTTAPVGTITVDADNDAQQTFTVPVGTPVTITILSATPREFHLHGYDLEQTGTKVVFEFTASQKGTFELEAHDDEQVILVLEVV